MKLVHMKLVYLKYQSVPSSVYFEKTDNGESLIYKASLFFCAKGNVIINVIVDFDHKDVTTNCFLMTVERFNNEYHHYPFFYPINDNEIDKDKTVFLNLKDRHIYEKIDKNRDKIFCVDYNQIVSLLKNRSENITTNEVYLLNLLI
jgi:hypothetical protein